MPDIQKMSDTELCRLVHEQSESTEFETELKTRLIERNAGAAEQKEKEKIETKVEDPTMISMERAIFVSLFFLLVQGFLMLYVVCPELPHGG